MRKALLIVLLLLAGCAGYEYGDVTSTVLTTQAEYCASADPYQRAVRMALLQRAGIELPSQGACADIIEVLSNEPVSD